MRRDTRTRRPRTFSSDWYCLDFNCIVNRTRYENSIESTAECACGGGSLSLEVWTEMDACGKRIFRTCTTDDCDISTKNYGKRCVVLVLWRWNDLKLPKFLSPRSVDFGHTVAAHIPSFTSMSSNVENVSIVKTRVVFFLSDNATSHQAVISTINYSYSSRLFCCLLQ